MGSFMNNLILGLSSWKQIKPHVLVQTADVKLGDQNVNCPLTRSLEAINFAVGSNCQPPNIVYSQRYNFLTKIKVKF